MNVQKRNDVSVYCLSSGPSLPEWIGERARRNLSRRDESIRRRIELIQDFQMPAASSRIVQSRDGRYVFVAGTYPPRIRCYDLHEMTMKFERYLNAEVVDLVVLGEDYGKLAILLDDRTIAFHAPYGAHESIRIPTFGRALAYEMSTCELLVAAVGNRVYRINLEEGRFGVPWTFEAANNSSSFSSSNSNNNNAAAVSATCIAVNQAHPMASVGCEDAVVRCWDARASDSHLRPFLKLDVRSAVAGYGYSNDDAGGAQISAVAHDPTGLYMAAGTSGGVVALYDVRSSRPLHIKEHKDGLPVHTVRFHPSSGTVLSSDSKLIKAWRYKSSANNVVQRTLQPHEGLAGGGGSNDSSSIGSVVVNIEGTGGKLTHFLVAGDERDPFGEESGVLLCAADQPKMESYFVPALGAAPKWCSFLENITEELEERDLQRGGDGAGAGTAGALAGDDKETIYENYKFVSRDDVEKLGISNLVGTPLLRGYMHGFFIDINLYNRVKAVANPFEYEEYRKKKLRERMEAKRASRIAPRPSDRKTKEKATVNPELAERLQDKAVDSTKAGKVAGQLLSDSRFGTLFTNPDFRIDEEADDFKLRNPSGVAAAKRRRNNLDSDEEDFSAEEEEEAESDKEVREKETEGGADDLESNDDSGGDDSNGSDSDSDSSDEDGLLGGKVRGEAYESMKASSNSGKRKGPASKGKKKAVAMYEAEELDGKSAVQLGLGSDGASAQARRRLDELNAPLAKRVARLQMDSERAVQVRVGGGSKEATFIPRDARRKMEREAQRRGEAKEHGKGKRQRRGVKELGLKTPFRHVKK